MSWLTKLFDLSFRATLLSWLITILVYFRGKHNLHNTLEGKLVHDSLGSRIDFGSYLDSFFACGIQGVCTVATFF